LAWTIQQRGAIISLVLLLCAALSPARADRPNAKAAPATPEDEAGTGFWVESPRTREAAAVQAIGVRDPYLTATLVTAGKKLVVWGQEPPPEFAPPLTREWLQAAAQDKAFPDRRRSLTLQQRLEMKAYCEALINAYQTPTKAFAKSAVENKWITWGHLFRDPLKYQGKVIPVEGRLVRLRREEPPLELQEEGIRSLYEGWIFTDTTGATPVCVMFTDLPKGVEIGEKINYKVRFNGYFFKRYGYISGEGPRRTLFFIAPTFEVLDTSRREESSVGEGLPFAMLGGMAALALATALLLLGLTWWFRRNDAHVRRRLAVARSNLLPEPELPSMEETAAPVAGELPAGSEERNGELIEQPLAAPEHHRDPTDPPLAAREHHGDLADQPPQARRFIPPEETLPEDRQVL
jgi:hypothetical protein